MVHVATCIFSILLVFLLLLKIILANWLLIFFPFRVRPLATNFPHLFESRPKNFGLSLSLHNGPNNSKPKQPRSLGYQDLDLISAVSSMVCSLIWWCRFFFTGRLNGNHCAMLASSFAETIQLISLEMHWCTGEENSALLWLRLVKTAQCNFACMDFWPSPLPLPKLH